MKSLTIFGACLLLAAVACDKPAEPKSDTSGASASTATTAAPAESAAAADEGEGIPTEADFEEEAEQKITAANLEEELDKIEKEIEN